jgi:Mor family transcriptional regulator
MPGQGRHNVWNADGKRIHCPIDLFPRQEAEISRLTSALNQAATVTEKVPWAEALLEAVDVLLACEHYDEASLNCRLCRRFSRLRRETASLVVKASRLSR